MKKRIVALLLALVMALGLAMPASATGLDGTTDPTIIGGAGEPVVITGDGVTTTPAAPAAGTDADTPAPTDTPTTGDSTTTVPTPPAAGDSTTTVPTPPAAPADGEDEDESDTPMPLLGMAPLSGGTPVVLAATPVNTEYLDASGSKETANAIPVTAGDTIWGTENKTTWYVVNADVTIDNTVTVAENSDVHLILADGAALTVNGKKTTKDGQSTGIRVDGSLTIYAQSAGANVGELTVTADPVDHDFSYGIRITSVGSLTVNGGVINVTGGDVKEANKNVYHSGGICVEGSMTINSGTVTATGGDVQSNDTATSDSRGISIYGDATMTVNGGTVKATGGNKKVVEENKTAFPSTNMRSSGIYINNNGTLNVNGGEVEATGGTAGDASSGIRMGKFDDASSASKLNVNGGKVTATGGDGRSSYGISVYDINTKTEVTLTSGTLVAASTGGNAFGVTANSFTHLTAPATYYLRKAASNEFTKCTAEEGKYKLDQSATYVELTTQPSGDKYIPYKNWDGTKLVDDVKTTSECGNVPTTLATGEEYVTWGTVDDETWYYVSGKVSISQTVKIRGDVHLILCDGAKLTVTVTVTEDNSLPSGIDISQFNETTGSLTIYGQSAQTGTLESTAGKHGIAIFNGSLTINGGRVTGTSSATTNTSTCFGIQVGDGSGLTVNSGYVTAEGDMYGLYVVGSATINGGTLIAKRNNTTGKAVYMKENSATFTPPTAYWWRTAETGDSAKYKTQNKYTVDALGGTYFELTTTQPADDLLDRVDYMNWDGSQLVKAYCESFTAITDSTTMLGQEGKTTWYVVKDNVTISGKLTAYGDVHLILCDNKTLTVNGGVVVSSVSDTDAGLTIYGQSGQTGKLVAKGGTEGGFSAGIKIDSYDALTINGGIIDATGGNAAEETPVVESYGIHGTYVVINNGTVKAVGGTPAPYNRDEIFSGGISVWELYINGNSKVTAIGGTATGTEGTSYGIRADLKITGGTMIAESASGKAVVFPDNGTITPPDAYWWRTADTAQYYTQKTFDSDKLDTETYFELTTTEQTNVASESVKYVGQDGSETSCDNYSLVPSAVDESTGAVIWGNESSTPVWYVVNKDTRIDGMVGVMGNVNLILCDGAKLTVTGGIGSYSEGSESYIDALTSGSLTIYGQTGQTGKLEVSGFADNGMSAGIMLGELTINGGEVEATGCDSTQNSALTISAGVLAMKLAVNGGKLTGTGGDGANISCGILGIIMSVNGQPSRVSVLGIEETEEEDENEAVVAAAPEIEGVGGDTTGDASIGIFSFFMAVDGVNIGEAMMQDSYDLAEDDPTTDSTTGSTTGSTCSAKITAMGGAVSATEGGAAVTRAGLGDISASCGLFACLLHVGVSAEDILGIMGGGESDGLSLFGENGDETTATTSAGSTAQINATGDSIGIATLNLGELGMFNVPAVWLNGGTLTATGAMSGIYKLDLSTFYSLDTFGLLGLDTFGIDTYGGTEDGTETAPAAPMIYVQKGTLIADATGTGKGLALGDPVSATVPLTCPAEYWWRINKAVNGYTKYPTKAYSYTGQHDYVEITTAGEGLLLLPEPGEDVTPQPPADTGTGSAQQPIRRQNGTVAALIPSAGKTDVESPETFDAGIALYVGLGVLSLTGSAAWVGKRKKW